jgi:MSHA biogenesis protein MshK
MAQRVIAGGAIALALAAPAASAQAIVDPMRPPQAVRPVEADKAAPASAPAARLQSVLIAANRRLAVIDGNSVTIGGLVGDSTVVEITESRVVLMKDNLRETLRLSPGVEKKPVPRPVPGKVTQ